MSHVERTRRALAYQRREVWAVQPVYFDGSTDSPRVLPEPEARRRYREVIARARKHGGGLRLLRGLRVPGAPWIRWRTVKAAFHMAENE